MSQYFNKDAPFCDNTTGEPIPFGVVYFGEPNTDPKDQLSNAKAPYEDREFLIPADSVQVLNSAGKLTSRLYLDGAYSITVTDANDVDIEVNPYWAGESSDNVINESSVAGATVTDALNALLVRVAALEASAVALVDLWPVGALYFTANNENPGSRLGFGTWVAEAAGLVIVGVGTGTDENGQSVAFSAGSTAGEYVHTLVTAESPSHVHALFSNGAQFAGNPDIWVGEVAAREFDSSGNNDQYIIKKAATQVATTGLSSSSGGDGSHNNIQPYITRYIWRRTA